MTRINCVPVEVLSDKHLLAEYKEITRPFNKVIKRIEKHGYDNALDTCNIPEKYTLNAGHETFFFNKLSWLHSRYLQLADELERRGFKIDWEKLHSISEKFKYQLRIDIHNTQVLSIYWKHWTPTPEDMYLNMARLVNRSKQQSVIKELNKMVDN